MPFDYTKWSESLEIATPQSWNISTDASVAHLSIEGVTADDLIDAIQFILPTVGIKDLGDGISKILRRSLPVPWPFGWSGSFPKNPTLWASRIEIEGMGTDKALRIPPGNGQVRWLGLTNQQAISGTIYPPFIGYEFYKFNIEFTPNKYFIIPDGNMDSMAFQFQNNQQTCIPEWLRYTERNPLPIAQNLTLPGSSLQFVDNPDFPGAPTNIAGTAFPQELNLIQGSDLIELTWKDVPADYVLGTTGLAKNFTNAMGHVNSDTFLNCPAETLLLIDNPEFISKPLSVFNWTVEQQGTPLTYPWLYDIKIRLRHFDPPVGFSKSQHRGWNVFPPRGQFYYLFANRLPFGQVPTDPNNPPNANNPPLWFPFDFRALFAYQPQ